VAFAGHTRFVATEDYGSGDGGFGASGLEQRHVALVYMDTRSRGFCGGDLTKMAGTRSSTASLRAERSVEERLDMVGFVA
jgi:hypothetical protein